MQTSEQTAIDTSLWIPQSMITGETYEGVVILNNASPSGQIVTISTSDPSIISIPDSISVPPYQNHGIFKIKTMRQGSVQVFAVMQGQMISSETSVYSSSTVPAALSILFPANKTKADAMIGYVLTVDVKGTPAPVLKDTQVSLRSSQMISVDEKIQIKQGSHYAKFFAKIKGSGKIFASAQGLKVGEGQLTKLQDEVTVRITVAPDIILEDSRAYLYVWLEKDGKPFKPPYVVHAFVSSNNLESARFNENIHTKYPDSMLRVSLVGGVGTGSLISANRGSAIITADVDGFGSAQTNVVVGPVLVDENFKFVETESRDKIKEIEKRKPNVAFVWAYPSITDTEAFGVVALYNMNSTKNTITAVDVNGTSVVITSSINRVEPVPIDGRIVTLISSSGLEHPNVISLSESNEIFMKRGAGFNHALEFHITGASQGYHTIFVSGPGLERFQTKLQVISPYTESYRINLVPIPSLPNSKQDIAMISIFDGQGALVDSQKAFAEPVDLSITTDSDEIKNLKIGRQNSAILDGELNESMHVVVSAEDIDPHESIITPSGIADSIRLEMPQMVHVLEEVPYAIHELNSNGFPMRKINFTSTSNTPGITPSGNRVVLDKVGIENFAVLSRFGADSKEIEAFANHMSLQITPRGITNRVDKDFEITVDSDVRDLQVIVDSPFPYKRINDQTYSITPDKEGHFNITFTGLKSGYVPTKSIFPVHAEKIFDVFFKAVGSDEKEIHTNSIVKFGDVSKSFVTPYQYELRPQFLNAEFPSTLEVGENGYKLDHVRVGDQKLSGNTIEQYVDSETVIVAQYQRMVKIQAENAVGGGYYPYDSVVTLSVPPKDKALFFVRDVFDHWEGIPYNADTVTLIAKENVSAKAVLRDDYSFLMLICGIVMTAIVYFRFVWKKGISPSWYIHKILNIDGISKIGSFIRSIRKKPGSRRKVLQSGDSKEIEF